MSERRGGAVQANLSKLLGPSLSLPVSQGQLVLGTWQQIIHLECDVRPRRRTVVVTVLGE